MNGEQKGCGGTVRVVVVMGVEASGKTTVGQMLAQALGWEFRDADEFHTAQAKSKMAAGIALTDEDRRPWLQSLRELIAEHLQSGHPMVLACSALKQRYRDILNVDAARMAFVYLRADIELIRERLRKRTGHFAGTALLESQFETLEEPRDAVIVDAAQPPPSIVAAIRAALYDSVGQAF
jgi:gluconokinase